MSKSSGHEKLEFQISPDASRCKGSRRERVLAAISGPAREYPAGFHFFVWGRSMQVLQYVGAQEFR